MRTPQQHNEKKIEIMEKCFECYAENGLTGTGIKALAKACDCTTGNLYVYFNNLDELIIESTAYCMAKVEDEFMAKAPHNPKDVMRFIEEIPYWTAEKHGKKYRLMYQIYTHPKYIEYGKKFFEGVNERYTAYAKLLEPQIGIPYTVIVSLIFIFDRACVHYAMFEDEYYAYNPKTGPATVRVEVTSAPISVVITFIDHGIPYDPLRKNDPDITLTSEEREIGGLGIFMVKKTMDEITYEYRDGQNILRIRKDI